MTETNSNTVLQEMDESEPRPHEHLSFEAFCRAAESIDDTSGNAMTSKVAELLNVSGGDLAVIAHFIQGEIFPAHDERKVKLGPSLMRDAIANAAAVEAEEVAELVAEMGGTGEVCEELDLDPESGQQTLGATQLTVNEVYETFADLSQISGSGSQAKKVQRVSDLLQRASPVEGKYISRLILSEMRIGVGAGTVRDAIAQAFGVSTELVERAIMVTNDIGEVAVTAREGGADALASEEMKVGIPVEPMLAQKVDLESLFDDAADGNGRVAVDVKYDGSRLQVHKDGDDVVLYTRGLEDETQSLPDIVELVREEVDAETAILDAEVTAVDPETGETLPFQEVTKRVGRKHGIEEKQEEINTHLHVFDILYADGDTLIDEPLVDRHEQLREVTPALSTEQTLVTTADEVNELQARAVNSGDEGVMVKDPQGAYKPGKRGKNWLKFKAQAETVDCVVVGAEWGEGERNLIEVETDDGVEKKRTIGAYMLAVRDDDGDLKTVGKVGTGLTDQDKVELTEQFEDLITAENGKEITFSPEVVFEIGFEELQPSPSYSSGYGLRFPRFERVRDEKRVEDADTLDRLKDIADIDE